MPTYRDLGDHSETVQVDYDPAVLSYEDLLAVFWADHDPTRPESSRQYRSAIFVHDEEQRRIAEASLAAEAARRGSRVYTAIEQLGTFTRAEDYHQKHFLRMVDAVEADLTRAYPDADALTDSTASARINGYLGGHGTLEQLDRDLPSFGLSRAGEAALRAAVEARAP